MYLAGTVHYGLLQRHFKANGSCENENVLFANQDPYLTPRALQQVESDSLKAAPRRRSVNLSQACVKEAPYSLQAGP